MHHTRLDHSRTYNTTLTEKIFYSSLIAVVHFQKSRWPSPTIYNNNSDNGDRCQKSPALIGKGLRELDTKILDQPFFFFSLSFPFEIHFTRKNEILKFYVFVVSCCPASHFPLRNVIHSFFLSLDIQKIKILRANAIIFKLLFSWLNRPWKFFFLSLLLLLYSNFYCTFEGGREEFFFRIFKITY